MPRVTSDRLWARSPFGVPNTRLAIAAHRAGARPILELGCDREHALDDALGDEVRVTVIAAGFDGGTPNRREDGRALGSIQSRTTSPAPTSATQGGSSLNTAPATRPDAADNATSSPSTAAPAAGSAETQPPHAGEPGAPAQPRQVPPRTVTFEAGVPVALDGEKLPGAALVGKLNALGGSHGVGRVNMMENRLVGIKSRELYETPAATILLAAHRDLESLTLDRETYHFKPYLELRWAELVYYGLWYTPLREAIDGFMAETQKRVNGNVTVKLFKGRAEAVARESEDSLYDYSLATYDAADQFDQSASEGFIKIWGLPAKVSAAVDRKRK